MNVPEELEHVYELITASSYARSFGVELESLDASSAVLHLPYSDDNSNPGGALHGGCAASLGVFGAHCITRAALGADAGPWHTASLQVNYLAAAKSEDVTARATLRRKGKALCFVDVLVANETDKPIAQITAMVHARFGAEPAERHHASGDDGAADPGPMGPHIGKIPFIGGRGIRVENMTAGCSRLVMPRAEQNGDAGSGLHEGAVLALLDTTGAMAAWAECGPGPYAASTPCLQAQILAPPPDEDLVAYGRTIERDGDLYWTDVEIAGAGEGRVVARGSVLYRIVT